MNEPQYPPLEGEMPRVYNDDDVRRWEEALRQLAVADAIIRQCDRCNIPASAARTDCDGLCRFFNALLAEHRGPQAPIGGRKRGEV